MDFFVERPPDEEISRLQETYGVPKMRSFHWDHHEEGLGDYEPCGGEAVLLIWDPEEGLVVSRPAGAPPEKWVIPMGRVLMGEVFEDGARREAREETGLEVDIEAIPAVHVCTFLFENVRLERWYFVCRAVATGGSLEPTIRDEMAESRYVEDYMALPEWRESEWYCTILKDGGLL